MASESSGSAGPCPGHKTASDDETTRSAAAARQSGAITESLRYETFVISARDSNNKPLNWQRLSGASGDNDPVTEKLAAA